MCKKTKESFLKSFNFSSWGTDPYLQRTSLIHLMLFSDMNNIKIFLEESWHLVEKLRDEGGESKT
jgi:hypothetical protein